MQSTRVLEYSSTRVLLLKLIPRVGAGAEYSSTRVLEYSSTRVLEYTCLLHFFLGGECSSTRVGGGGGGGGGDVGVGGDDAKTSSSSIGSWTYILFVKKPMYFEKFRQVNRGQTSKHWTTCVRSGDRVSPC